MNEKLIKTLKEEREKIYPNGCPICPRGSSKTYLYLSHFLRYTAYDLVCDLYKTMTEEVNLETAHEDINYFVAGIMSEV